MVQVNFKILRQRQGQLPKVQSYLVEAQPGNTILDCLNQIKWEQDGSLAFRKNCRNTICGSCGMRINGRSALACKENVGQELARMEQIAQRNATDINPSDPCWSTPTATSGEPPEITIAPLGNMPVIKDLVVDMRDFWTHLKAIDPYVSTRGRQIPEREFLQTPAERDRLNQTGNCIMCGACYSECNAREVNPDFVGPHALAKANRLVTDTRDQQTDERLAAYSQGTAGVWGCTRCYYCNSVCPMDVAPMDQISQLKQEILHRSDAQTSRSVRHRKVLINLVKQGGWIDERKFGLQVVGNNFRDWQGLASLGPLGLRMLARGKFPLGFDPSAGQKTVEALIEAVQACSSTHCAPGQADRI